MDWQEVEQQIREIPGNGPVLEKLCKLLESGEAIALVGVGASAGLWPLWDDFLKGFVDHVQKNGNINKTEAKHFKKEALQEPLETAQFLRDEIEPPIYFEYLRKIFCDEGKKNSETNGGYTPTHKALLQLPIQNYLTLNYDPGLTNARAVIYPKATTSYYFWNKEEARKILDINQKPKKLILHAHGRFDWAESIILTLDDYRRAYSLASFTRLLNTLFEPKRKLIIVGFGWGDPYIKQLFNNISRDYKTLPIEHIAIVGLENKDIGIKHLIRKKIEKVYRANTLFYPSKDHHKTLSVWLNALVEKYASTEGAGIAEETKAPEVSSAAKRLKDNYVHNPTNDENYQGRVNEIAALNRWGKDPSTKIIGITGIGGQGKISLVGHWLKEKRDKELENMPVFYWSFYEDLDIPKFFKTLSDYLLQVVKPTVKMESLQFVLAAVRKVRVLLVLDGLEVIQEEDDNRLHHGFFKDPLLLQFLKDWGRSPHQSLMILTSRFSYPELSRFSGVGFHQLNLVKLSNKDGAALLEKLGVWTKEKDTLYEYVVKLHGHPLLLRVLSATVNRGHAGRLDEFEGSLFLDALPDEKLESKFKHMFEFYEQQLHDGQKELLGIISLFKRPTEIKSFLPLVKNMKSLKGTDLEGMEEREIQKQIDILIKDFLVEKTREGITCHPVIRDYFRDTLKLGGVKKEAADFLSKRPGRKIPQTIEEVRDLVDVVVLLCEARELKTADGLVKSRLAQGGYGFNVFRNLPALVEGYECDLAFVKDETRCQKTEKELGSKRVAFYMAEAGLHEELMGNLLQAREWRYKTLEIFRLGQNKHGQSLELFSIASIEIGLGNIREALILVSKALDFSRETRYLSDLRTERVYQSYYQFLMGKTDLAYKGFETALAYEQKRISDVKFLYSVLGNQQVEFLIRLKSWDQLQQVNDRNIELCQEYNSNNDLAHCHFLQGWAEVQQGNLEDAENVLCEADKILRTARMPQELCRLDWAWGLLAEAQGDYQKGVDKVNESLSVSADKGFRLWQADGLTLRGRLRIMQFKRESEKDTELLERAGDDGREALAIADDTGYIWAKIEALELLSSYHQTKAALPGTNTEDETEQAQRYAREAASLQEGLYLTEEQMEQLKIQARKEFEAQTANWNN